MRIKLLILALLTFFFGVNPVFAEFTFTVPNTTITSGEEIETTVILFVQGQNSKTYYFEGAFKKESSNYFGLTWNDSSWVKYTSSNFTILKSITTDTTGKWNGIVKVKIDKDNSLFSGGGTYTLRMKRFTTGGSDSWADNSIDLAVNSPPSPTPTPTSTPKPTAKPSPTPTPVPTTKPPSVPKSSPAPNTSTSASDSNREVIPNQSEGPSFVWARRIAGSTQQIASVAAATTSSTTSSATPSAEAEIKDQKLFNPIFWTGSVLLFAGGSSLGYIYWKRKKQ